MEKPDQISVSLFKTRDMILFHN